MTKIIGMFNHKGGVSKTTSTYHLGWMLTNLGHRVLLVDADSQCNLSNIALGEEGFEELYQIHPNANLKSALSPAFEAKPIELSAAHIVPVKGNNKLLLLAGSFDLTEYDVPLGVSFTLSETMGTLQNLPGSFNYLLQKTAAAHSIDYVLVDMNPSLSAINQAILISCDYFLVPMSPDSFSAMAIKSLAKILPRWENWAKKARTAFADAAYPLPQTTAKFLGTIVQRFNIRKGNPTKPTQAMINTLTQLIQNELVPALGQVGMLLPAEKYNSADYCLARVPDFQSLNSHYQDHGVPIFELTAEQMGYGGTVKIQYQATQDKFRKTYQALGESVVSLTT